MYKRQPNILKKLIFSLKNKIDKKIIITGEDVYIIPILAIVVVMPARFGKAPHIPHPIEPKKNSLENSLLNSFLCFKISLKKKGNNMMNTVNHRQNAKEIGGTNSTPPLATIVFVAIKIG